MAHAESAEWLVIETQYPTEYGCYRGRKWTRLDLIRRSDVSVHGPFSSYEDAVADAQERAQSDCRFEGYDFEELWPEEPPYDSAEAENWDNDEEIRFEVMTRSEHENAKAADRSYAALACGKLNFKAALKRHVLAAQVRSAKRTYYSWRPDPDLDIPAELEVVEKLSGGDAGAFLALKSQDQDAVDPAGTAAGKRPARMMTRRPLSLEIASSCKGLRAPRSTTRRRSASTQPKWFAGAHRLLAAPWYRRARRRPALRPKMLSPRCAARCPRCGRSTTSAETSQRSACARHSLRRLTSRAS